MEHTSHNWIFAGFCGAGGGMFKFYMLDASFINKLMEAGATAVVCGLLGAFGKWLFDLSKVYFKTFLKKKKP